MPATRYSEMHIIPVTTCSLMCTLICKLGLLVGSRFPHSDEFFILILSTLVSSYRVDSSFRKVYFFSFDEFYIHVYKIKCWLNFRIRNCYQICHVGLYGRDKQACVWCFLDKTTYVLLLHVNFVKLFYLYTRYPSVCFKNNLFFT